jgi:hypothetical protein
VKVQKVTHVTPVKKNLHFPAFDSKKSKRIAKFRGIAGYEYLVVNMDLLNLYRLIMNNLILKNVNLCSKNITLKYKKHYLKDKSTKKLYSAHGV